MRAGVVQLNSIDEPERNRAAAKRLVEGAAAAGADLVVLPEKWNLLGPAERLRDAAEPLDGPSLSAAREWARALGIHLLAGSIAERARRTSACTTPRP